MVVISFVFASTAQFFWVAVLWTVRRSQSTDGVVGNIAGVPVVTDAGIPTNLGAGTDEDRVVVARRSDLLLWETGTGAPAVARFDSVGSGSLTIKIVAFGYSAFTAGRYPTGVAVCQGTLFNATL